MSHRLRRHDLIASVAALMALAAGPATPAFAGATAIATERVASGLAFPVFATHAPGDTTRLFILEKPGRIRILNLKTGTLLAAPFLDIDALVGGGSTTGSEQGLLGLAFHPNYQSNGYFFVYYTNNSGDTVVARYTRSDPDTADDASALSILQVDQPQANHNAGWLAFGPNDGFLYISLGDGGNYCDTGTGHTTGTGNAQDITSNLLGKILRIDIDGDDFPVDAVANYAIPPSNPFVGVTGDDEIWAYGLRNPWRCSFDAANGDLYIGDVGQDAREEIDYLPASNAGGANFGWRCMEGNACSSDSGCDTSGCTCNAITLTDPVHDYLHAAPPAPTSFICAVTGGYVYRGCAIPDLAGNYFFADYCGNGIWSFVINAGVATNYTDRTADLSPSLGAIAVNQIVAFGEDARGEMYIVDQGSGADGQVFRIRAADYAVPYTDVVCDLNVDVLDLLALLGKWGPCAGCAADVNGDDLVDVVDLLQLLADWGSVTP